MKIIDYFLSFFPPIKVDDNTNKPFEKFDRHKYYKFLREMDIELSELSKETRIGRPVDYFVGQYWVSKIFSPLDELNHRIKIVDIVDDWVKMCNGRVFQTNVLYENYRKCFKQEDKMKTITYEVKVYDECTEWYLNGYLHREDGPAKEYSNGTKAWFKNGRLHREDGPAVEYCDGSKEWFLEGIHYSEKGYNLKMNPPVLELTMEEVIARLGVNFKLVKG